MLKVFLDCHVGFSARLAMTVQGESMKQRQPAVYIMANKRNGTLYTGVTSALPQRAYAHKNVKAAGFTAKYGCHLLVWYEIHETMESAILKEKQVKGGRARKSWCL